MNYQESKKNVAITLFVMEHDAAKELERAGYVKVVKGKKGRKVYFLPTEINLEPLIEIYTDEIMQDLLKNNTNVTVENSIEIVSKYKTVTTFKQDIIELQGRIED